MKTALSIDDVTFSKGERLAKKLKISRSQFYVGAIRKRICELEDAEMIEAINRVCDDPANDDPETEALVVSAGKRTLARSEW